MIGLWNSPSPNKCRRTLALFVAAAVVAFSTSAMAEQRAEFQVATDPPAGTIGTVVWGVVYLSPTVETHQSLLAKIVFPEVSLVFRLLIYDHTGSVLSPGVAIGIGPGQLPSDQLFESLDRVAVIPIGGGDPILLSYEFEFGNFSGTGGSLRDGAIADDIALLLGAEAVVLEFTTVDSTAARMILGWGEEERAFYSSVFARWDLGG